MAALVVAAEDDDAEHTGIAHLAEGDFLIWRMRLILPKNRTQPELDIPGYQSIRKADYPAIVLVGDVVCYLIRPVH